MGIKKQSVYVNEKEWTEMFRRENQNLYKIFNYDTIMI